MNEEIKEQGIQIKKPKKKVHFRERIRPRLKSEVKGYKEHNQATNFADEWNFDNKNEEPVNAKHIEENQSNMLQMSYINEDK